MAENRYWSVNHKQTHKQEIEDGFLWSPFTKVNGGKNRFYDNMAETRPGDVVISYASKVSYIGVVTQSASKAPKPANFGSAGESWGNTGWRIPVTWSALPTPVSTIDNIGVLRDLLPASHSPLQHTNGHGNQGCYLAEISHDLYSKICELGSVDPKKLYAANEFDSIDDEDIELQIIEQAKYEGALSESEIGQLQKSRRKQGKFRENVLKLIQSCPITGVRQKDLLIASHIKPWKSCGTLHERLDGYNGLPLAPHIDRLFDKGLITFSVAGELMTSAHLDLGVVDAWRFGPLIGKKVIEVGAQRAVYLEYHRAKIFRR